MPIYPVRHKETGEEQTLNMTIANYEQWRKDNPDWDKDWSKGVASAQEVGDWQNKLVSRNPGWNDVLGKAAKAPGSRVKKFSFGKHKKCICRQPHWGWTHYKTDEKKKTTQSRILG